MGESSDECQEKERKGSYFKRFHWFHQRNWLGKWSSVSKKCYWSVTGEYAKKMNIQKERLSSYVVKTKKDERDDQEGKLFSLWEGSLNRSM